MTKNNRKNQVISFAVKHKAFRIQSTAWEDLTGQTSPLESCRGVSWEWEREEQFGEQERLSERYAQS